MTDCGICGKPIGEHEPWLVWHTGGDEDGVVLCRVCAGAAQYALDLGSGKCVPELDEELDWWARKTLWNAVWDPGVLTVAEADAARHWLDRMDRADMDPAADCLLEAACLKRSGCWWRMATDDAHEVERRLRDA